MPNNQELEINARSKDEIRQLNEHLSQRPELAAALQSKIRSLFESQRQEFVQALADGYIADANRFLEYRTETETYAEYAFSGSETAAGMVYATMLRRSVENAKHALVLLTEPDPREKAVRGFWRNAEERREWLVNKVRKPFKVNLRPDAMENAIKIADKVAERILEFFLYRTTRKVLAILEKSPQYFPQMVRGRFDYGIEGEIRLTFADTKSFVMKLGIKHNRSVHGNQFLQYPLTFHDVYPGTGNASMKSASIEQIEEIFGVKPEDRWTPVPMKKEPKLRIFTRCEPEAPTSGTPEATCVGNERSE